MLRGWRKEEGGWSLRALPLMTSIFLNVFYLSAWLCAATQTPLNPPVLSSCFPSTDPRISSIRRERVPEEDRRGGGVQPGGGNRPAGRQPVHQDVHQRPHHPRLLHRGPVLQRGHRGRTPVHGAHSPRVTEESNLSHSRIQQNSSSALTEHMEIISVRLQSLFGCFSFFVMNE